MKKKTKSVSNSPQVLFANILNSLMIDPIKCLHSASAAAAKLLQSCPTLCDTTDGLQPTRILCPWDFPGKSTGVECHCLLRNVYITHYKWYFLSFQFFKCS